VLILEDGILIIEFKRFHELTSHLALKHSLVEKETQNFLASFKSPYHGQKKKLVIDGKSYRITFNSRRVL
jgi:hypothetical protein